MKRKIILIAHLVAISLIFAIPCFAQQQNIVSDDFENYTSKCNEGGIWNEIPVVCSGGNTSAVIGAGKGQTLYSQTLGYTPDVSGICASFSVKFNGNTKQHVIFGASESPVPSNARDRLLQFYSGGEKMQIAAETNIPISYKTDVWYDVTLELSYETGAYSLKVSDGRNTKTWSVQSSKLAKTNERKYTTKYYSFWIDSNSGTESVQIDNVHIYGITEYRTVCFYVNSNKYAVCGNILKLDGENNKVVTSLINQSACVPADVLCNSLDITIVKSDNSYLLSDNQKNLIIGADEYALYEGVVYFPLRKLSEYFGYKVFYDKSGLIVISKADNYIKPDTEGISYFRDITYALCCDEPSVQDIYNSIASGNLTHPRIILNNELINTLKTNISSYPRMAYWYEQIKTKAKEILNQECLSYKPDSYSGILDAAQKARTRIPQLALVYLVDGEEVYAQRAVSEMLSISSFPDWYPYRSLDTAEINLAIGIGYDWLYNYMKEKKYDISDSDYRECSCRKRS